MNEEDLQATLPEMRRILSSVASEDAMWILHEAKNGIKSSTRTIRDLGLTQKRYYTRLKGLIEAGLIEKSENEYRHTMIGNACYRLGGVFSKILSNRDQFDMLTRLKNVDAFSSAEKKKITEALSIDETLGLSNLLSPVTMIDNYEDLVHETVSLLEKAENVIYFATQYFDMRVVDVLLRKIKSNVEFNILYDFKSSSHSRLNLVMRMFLTSPKIIKFFYEWLKSKKLYARIIELPYTFIIIDDKYALIELQKPFEDTFSLAFIFENPILCSRLKENFNALWNRGSEFDLTKSLVDSLKHEDPSPYENVKMESEILLKRNGEASKKY